MTEPKWISIEEIEFINQKETERTREPHGIINRGVLESGTDRARNLHAYGENDLHLLAAAYAEGIAGNHAFEQANKRTAFAAADLFLFKNGIELQARSDDAYINMMVDLVEHRINRDNVSIIFRENSQEIDRDQSQDEQGLERKKSIAQQWDEKKASRTGDNQKTTQEQSPTPTRNRDRSR